MLRILIAEDNQRFREGLRRLLEVQPDCQVVAEAADGNEAIVKAGEFHPDIIILDYMLPHLDGLSAAEQIRKTLLQTEIIMLTQHDAPFTARRAIRAGVCAFVVKSDASRELREAIDAAKQHKTFLSSTVQRNSPQQTPWP